MRYLSLLIVILLANPSCAETVRIQWHSSAHSAPWVPGNDYIDGWTNNFMNGTVEERGRVQLDGELEAEILLPKGAKPPVPFVVMLHGCSGMNRTLRAWAVDYGSRILAAGYGIMVLDSFKTRGVGPDGICNDPSQLEWARRRADDAYSALDYLLQRGLAHPKQVYVLGRSNGATTTLITMNQTVGDLHQHRFAGGFAMQPSCRYMEKVQFYATVRLYLAEKDEATSPALCLTMAASSRTNPVSSTVWKGADHAFEDREPLHALHGYHVGYNKEAAEGTIKVIVDSLRKDHGPPSTL
jgi:dienelactone hydrolase